MTEFTAEAETIVLTLPADLPVGSAVKDESVKNTIRVVSDFGEAVLNLEFRGPAPIVDRVSHTLAKAGERIRIYGHNFANVTKVVFPGDVSVTTKGTGEEPETGTFIINEAGTTIDVIVPDGGDALPGALYVEAEADNGGYSYSYMNCKDNIFISSFKRVLMPMRMAVLVYRQQLKSRYRQIHMVDQVIQNTIDSFLKINQ